MGPVLSRIGSALSQDALGEAGRSDDGGIHDAAPLERQALARVMLVDRLENVVGEIGGFEQLAQVQTQTSSASDALAASTPAGTACHRIVRLDQPEQRLSRHHQFHFFQEHLTPRLLALAGVLRIRKTDLALGARSLRCSTSSHDGRWTCSAFL